ANGTVALSSAGTAGASSGGVLYEDGRVSIPTDTLRVGLRYYYSEERDSSMMAANLENAVGCGYAFGYLEDGTFVQFDDEDAQTDETQITMRPFGDTGIGVYITGTDTLLYSVERTGVDDYFAVHPLCDGEESVTWFSGRRYYGDFAYADLGNGQITVVNVVETERYVAGVCAGEMGGAFPAEALKAQAIAARTYAMFTVRAESYVAVCGFDLTNDDYCQVYLGYTDAESILSAVAATENLYLTCDGALINALFFAADGGSTLNSEDVFRDALPYLRGVEDPYESSAWTQGAYGHRVGMSQWGAYAMAKYYDMDYRDILGFYYTGVGLSYGE
ncbi:MAG: SpoIID/LytB domain-containing protein, partial [Oscillospiraceae bacterium]|nr:SpoIID/LytB domain-containing protein [Oscillospiraceae bacterium]